jgi:hypothetical protein
MQSIFLMDQQNDVAPFGHRGAGDLVRDRHGPASLFAGDDIASQLSIEMYWLRKAAV